MGALPQRSALALRPALRWRSARCCFAALRPTNGAAIHPTLRPVLCPGISPGRVLLRPVLWL
eukprot:9839047-Alexandrium_andersonii.AAC.1